MTKAPVTITEMLPKIMDILESYGYEKHYLWGTMYGNFSCIARYYRDRGIVYYDPSVTNAFLKDFKVRYRNKEFARTYYSTVCKAASRLNEFFYNGTLEWNCNKRGTKFELNQEYTRLLDAFLSSREFHRNTKWDFAWAIRKYLHYHQMRGLTSLDQVNVNDTRQFIIDTAKGVTAGSLHNLLCYIRQFHIFLRETGEPTPDCVALLSYHVPRKMPVRDYVTDDELDLLMEQIDCNTIQGKRDKAIISLGATTGLRAIDIVQLKLTDIDWYKGEIHLRQSKTGGILSLPILPETGEAIKDYILNGRPELDIPEIFLRVKAPIQALDDGVAIGYVFDQYAIRAGIRRRAFDGKSFCGLRRRLARNMLISGTPITTIAQVLGHEGMETAKQYLSLDSQNLKECALDFSGIPLERGDLL